MNQQRLKELLHYEPETGIWTWLVRQGNRSAGSRAGAVKNNGYRHIRIDGAFYMEHRLAFLYMEGKWPDQEGEHKNRKRDDNRWDNLREATHTQNQQNARKTTSKTGYRGVYAEPRSGKFYAQIKVGGRTIALGTFLTAEEANKAREDATIRYHGEFAYCPAEPSLTS